MAYSIIAQTNSTTTLADENGNVITVPSRSILEAGTTFTLVKINNNTATLEDSNGKVYRDIPCCIDLTQVTGFNVTKVNNNKATLEDGDGKVYAGVPCIVNLTESGGGGGGTITSLNVTPSTSAQTITATGGVDGYSPVNVSAVDASIDANITAGNIKDGVTILGVTGNYTGGAPALYREFQLDSTGKLQPNTTTTHIMNFTGMVDVSDYALARAYYGNTAISGAVDMSDLTTVSGTYACYYMFQNCVGLTSANLSSLTTISGSYACSHMFEGCVGLTSANLSSLTTISGSYACNYMFSGCTGLTSANLSSLTTITANNACVYMFQSCTSLATVYIGGTTAIDFGIRTNQFTNMFSGCTQNIDVYAPAANQAQIEAFSGYPNFGGTGTLTWHWRS